MSVDPSIVRSAPESPTPGQRAEPERLEMDSSVHTAQHARSIDLTIPTRVLQDALLAFASAEQIYARTQIAKIQENSEDVST